MKLIDILRGIPQAQRIRIYTYNKKITISGKVELYLGIRAQFQDRYLGYHVWTVTSNNDTLEIELI